MSAHLERWSLAGLFPAGDRYLRYQRLYGQLLMMSTGLNVPTNKRLFTGAFTEIDRL